MREIERPCFGDGDGAAEEDLTALLEKATTDPEAANELGPRLYELLHKVAKEQRRRQAPWHTLETADLVNEAYLRLFGCKSTKRAKSWQSREHFLGACARAMRTILVDHARRRNRQKRLPPGKRVPLDDVFEQYDRRCGGLEELDLALTKLSGIDSIAARIVELKFFSGLNTEEIAQAVDLPLRTVERKLALARSWIRKEVTGCGP